MKIKVGGRYVARNGEVVSIVRKDKVNCYYPFEASNGLCFTENGFYWSPAFESDHDLMHEFKDEGAPIKLSTILTGLFWLAVIIGMIGFWGMAAFKLWQMLLGN